jgi:hypothetical protein
MGIKNKTDVKDNAPDIRTYTYKRKYLNKDGSIATYEQKQNYIVQEHKKYSDDLQGYILQTLDNAKIKIREINKIEVILKTILRYRGYNRKNLMQRIYRLESADEINSEDKKLLRKIMDRQKTIAGDLTSILTFILELYDVHDSELKDMAKQLQEYKEP